MSVSPSDSRWKAAGLYNKPMSVLAEQIEAWDEAAKATEKAFVALGHIQELLNADPDGIIEGLPGITKYAPDQKHSELQDLLQKGQRIAIDIVSAYDEMNSAYLRMGLK